MQAYPFVYFNLNPRFPIVLGLLTVLPTLGFAEPQQLPPTKIQSEATNTEIEQYVFDSAFFQGSQMNQKALMRLSKGDEITAGTYKVDLYINNQFIENTSIQFKETESNSVQPCFELNQLKRASILIDENDTHSNNSCSFLEQRVDNSSSHFDLSRLRLDLSIPQTLMKQVPRGYIAPSQLDDGTSIGFINYYANYYHNSYDGFGHSYQQDSSYLSLNGGINIGKWQFRQQSSLVNNESGTKWNNIRSYVKRPITSIRSELTAGQLNSTGRFFSGLSFNGINLSSDERMLPDSVRGYAPVVQGNAKTTARVSVFQNSREIYQTTVSPGPFRITDLYPTSYNGDLDVIVTEADGSKSEFKVPFSAVPESVRQGSFKYNFDLGRTRDIGEDTNFANITTQYGLSNAITLNSGIRIAEGYQSAMVGSAYTSFLGAFGTEATYSHAEIPNEGYIDGWMFGANYSKTFQNTNTTIALAGYRFSTEGYRDLSDILGLRQSVKDGTPFQSSTFQEQSRATVVLNQSFGDIGTLYLSGSASRYRDNKPDDYQLQLGYGKTFKNGTSLNFSVSRQKSAYQSYNNQNINTNFNYKFDNKNQTTFGLSISIPLNKTNFAKDLMLNYNNSSEQNTYQATLNGNIEKFENLDYNVGINYDDQSNITVWNMGLNNRFNYANTSLNFSKGNNYWQSSANIQGALAIHSGGITFGPYLSDTFALIEAKGAYGASVLNAQGTKINKSGYALVPALTPYKYNNIAINPEGMASNTEVNAGDTKIAPYAGSTVKVKFNTRQGYALLIQSQLQSGIVVPLGAEVLNENDENIGMTGQNGQIYLRAEKEAGTIVVKWGDESNDQCSVQYEIPESDLNSPLIHLTEICKIQD